MISKPKSKMAAKMAAKGENTTNVLHFFITDSRRYSNIGFSGSRNSIFYFTSVSD